MKSYKRNNLLSVAYNVLGILNFFVALLNIFTNKPYEAAVTFILAIGFIFVGIVYNRPYLFLGDDKLIINYGLRRKILPLSGAVASHIGETYFELVYNLDGVEPKRVKVQLALMKKETKQEFLLDLRSIISAD